MKTTLKNLALFLILNLFMGVLAHAQWVSSYQAPSHSDANIDNAVGVGVSADNNKNCYITGYVYNDATLTEDILTVKYNKRGDTVWTKIYSGTDPHFNNKSFGIEVDNSGNVYVVGQVSRAGKGLDLVLLKYSPSGALLWDEFYSGSENNTEDAGLAMTLKDGFIYVTGFVTGYDGYQDIVIIKYNTDGNRVWERFIDGPEDLDSKGYGIVVDNPGNVYITGYTESTVNGSNIIVAKYNSAGTYQWDCSYSGGGIGEDKAFGIVVDQLNNVYITGYSYEYHRGAKNNFDCITLKYSSSGKFLWKRAFNGISNGEDRAVGIVGDENGNVYITGYTQVTNVKVSTFDYITLKYNASGEMVWQMSYNGDGNGDDKTSAITFINGGNIAVTGSSWGTGGNYDFATVAYNKNNGNMIGNPNRWSMNNYSNDYAKDITAIEAGNTYVTGFSRFWESNGNAPVQSSVVSTMSINWGNAVELNTGTNSPERFILHQNYPNPFNPSTSIRYDVLKASEIRIAVYDFLGREVATLVNEYRKEGTYTVKFNASSLASGIYFYEIVSDGFRDTKKMTLIK